MNMPTNFDATTVERFDELPEGVEMYARLATQRAHMKMLSRASDRHARDNRERDIDRVVDWFKRLF